MISKHSNIKLGVVLAVTQGVAMSRVPEVSGMIICQLPVITGGYFPLLGKGEVIKEGEEI